MGRTESGFATRSSLGLPVGSCNFRCSAITESRGVSFHLPLFPPTTRFLFCIHTGGSGSGKTHVARQIVRSLGSIPSVVILSQDSFYKRHTPEELVLAHASLFDFDHPDRSIFFVFPRANVITFKIALTCPCSPRYAHPVLLRACA